MSEIGTVLKVVDSHLCKWGSIPSKSCSFLIVSLSKGLSLCFLRSDQQVKYWILGRFPLTSSLLLDYHVIQYTYILLTSCYQSFKTRVAKSYLQLTTKIQSLFVLDFSEKKEKANPFVIYLTSKWIMAKKVAIFKN